MAGFNFSEVDGLWYSFFQGKNTWNNALEQCQRNHLGSSLPISKSAAQVQIAFDYWHHLSKFKLSLYEL